MLALVSCSHHEHLVAAQFPHGYRRVGRDETLQYGRILLGAEGVEQPDQAVWLKPVLHFIDQRDGGTLRGHSLKPRHKQAGRPRTQRAQRDPLLIVQGDGPVTDGDRVSIQQRLHPGPYRDTEFAGFLGDGLDGLGQLSACAVAEAGAGVASGIGEFSPQVWALLGESVQD